MALFAPLLALLTALAILQFAANWLGNGVAGMALEQRYVDDASYVEHVVRQFRPDSPAVVFLGGSVTREGVLEDDRMASLLQNVHGRAPAVRNLAYSSFSPVEALAILDTLVMPAGSVVALQLSWQNLVESQADVEALLRRPRIAQLHWNAVLDLASPAVRLELAATPSLIRHAAVIANYLDQRSCAWFELVTAAARAACFRPLKVQRNFYTEAGRLSVQEKRAAVAVAHAELQESAVRNQPFAEALYQRFGQRARDRGLLPVLVVYPRDRTEMEAMSRHGLDRLEEAVMGRLRAAMVVLDLRHPGNLEDADFADPLHLLGRGRTQVSELLAVEIGRIIETSGRTSNT